MLANMTAAPKLATYADLLATPQDVKAEILAGELVTQQELRRQLCLTARTWRSSGASRARCASCAILYCELDRTASKRDGIDPWQR